MFKVLWHPGATQKKWLIILQNIFQQGRTSSPTMFLRAAAPKFLQGCVGTLNNAYVHTYTKSGPLPRIAPFKIPTAKLVGGTSKKK